MANNPLIYDAASQTTVNAFTATLNSGFLQIFTGAQPSTNGALTGTLLASLTFSGTAFAGATSSAGTTTAVANAIGNGSASNTGTAGYFALLQSNGTTVVATGSVGTSGADLNLSTLSILVGQTVSCSSFTVTMAET